jgi:hypothetical protein
MCNKPTPAVFRVLTPQLLPSRICTPHSIMPYLAGTTYLLPAAALLLLLLLRMANGGNRTEDWR